MKEIIHEILNDNLVIFSLHNGDNIKVIRQQDLPEIAQMIEDGILKESSL